MTTTRTCPICGSEFAPKNHVTITCGVQCSRRVKHLRKSIKAFNAGAKDLREGTLESIMRLLEADEVVNAARAEIEERKALQFLADELEDLEEYERFRERQRAMLAFHRKGALGIREGRAKLLARGWRPMVPEPPLPPEQRSIKRLDLSRITRQG